MKIAAIISEYNPFHNGHKYQTEMLKKEYDAVIAVMSGNFVQRGEIALCDKWSRTKLALLNGVDLVVELPVIYALNSAEKFAEGGVRLIDKMGVVDCLCFGAELGKIDEFYYAAEILNNEPQEVSEKINKFLDMGMSFPSAREKAYEGIINPELLKSPNNILGVEYVKALKKIGSKVVAKTIKRIGAGYNDLDYSTEFSSATAIRELIKENEDYKKYMSENSEEIIKNAEKFSEEKLINILKYVVLLNGKEYIGRISDVNEGLENKIFEAVKKGDSFENIAWMIKSKRYTMSRIRRILYSVILDIGKDFKEPEYIRILGMNNIGKNVLKEMKEKATLPIVIKTADFSSEMLKKDIFATDVAYMTTNGKTGMDYLTSPVIV